MAIWFHQIGPQQYESLDYQTLQKRWYEGCLRPDDLVWTEGMPYWQPAKTIPNLMPAPYIHQPTCWNHKDQTCIEKHDGAFVLLFGLLCGICFFTGIGIQAYFILLNGRNNIALSSVTFGNSLVQIILIMLSSFFGIEAISMGYGDLKKMHVGKMDPTGQGMTRAGYILGIVFSSLLLLMIVICFISVIAYLLKSNGKFQ